VSAPAARPDKALQRKLDIAEALLKTNGYTVYTPAEVADHQAKSVGLHHTFTTARASWNQP
jgi:hypothetical protein